MFYKKNQDFRLVGYCDVDYVGDKVERKSTSGGCHYIRPCLISWTGKKQNQTNNNKNTRRDRSREVVGAKPRKRHFSNLHGWALIICPPPWSD